MGKIKLILGATILLFSFTAKASLISAPQFLYLDQSGREWMDLNEIAGFNWVDIASACNNVSGECSGVLDRSVSSRWNPSPNNFYSTDLDLTGVTWASNQDVTQLFYEVAGLPPGSLDDGFASFPGSEMRGELFASSFNPSHEIADVVFDGQAGFEVFDGFTRTLLFDSGLGFLPGRGFVFNNTLSQVNRNDVFGIGTFGHIYLEARGIEFGAWAYRDVSPVPVPAAIWLFGTGLIGLIGFTRRRKAA